jgi:hypothetical protein
MGRKSLWVIFYQGQLTLPVFLTKQTALADLRGRPVRYYTLKKDYELIRYDATRSRASGSRAAVGKE